MIWVGMPVVGRKLTRMLSKLENLVLPSGDDDQLSGSFKVRSKSLRASSYMSDDDESLGSDRSPPRDVPHGHLAVYVGREKRRFVIATQWLSHKLFKDLLAKSEKEFGFEYSGGLMIPCEVEVFQRVLSIFSNQGCTSAHDLDLDELLNSDCHVDHYLCARQNSTNL